MIGKIQAIVPIFTTDKSTLHCLEKSCAILQSFTISYLCLLNRSNDSANIIKSKIQAILWIIVPNMFSKFQPEW